MNTILDLNVIEISSVAGGNPEDGQSWYDYLNDRFPGGEWVGNSFFPNGAPEFP
ncbi:hypothetical protein [Erythrobacter insulae]|uniref:hypothetical protein n=1 Tax=Erythrobacter insulae TaxID=2584124 RepID=UPI00163DAA6D|nr:hypothetical protein [Erythrobacter insulae]